MKKYILFLVVFLSITTFVSAQRGGGGKNRMESYRIAYITDKLSLTPEEAQRFWPIYNQFRDQLKEILKMLKIKKR